jgi:hypothetical protein
MTDRDFAGAERILAADPKQEFEGGDRTFVCQLDSPARSRRSESDAGAASKTRWTLLLA